MIRTLTAFTEEIDDTELAVNEILSQLDLAGNLLKNSVGIIACHRDFMEEGIIKTLCDKLPFDVAGINTLHSAITGRYGQFALSVAVLTSDDVQFSTGVSGPITADHTTALTDLYNKTAGIIPEKPVMMLTFAPLIPEVGGDEILGALSGASGGLPNFGTIAFDYGTGVRSPRVIFNGESYPDRLALVLFYGNVKPKFTIFSIPENKIRKQKAVITKSDENVLYEINNMPALKYMESLGLSSEGTIHGLHSVPMVLDYNDGTQAVVRTIMSLAPEGHLICGGSVPVDCTLSVGAIEHEDILQTMEEAIEKIKNADGALIFSCGTRNFALEADYLAEMEKLTELSGTLPLLFAYSGGEFCPVPSAGGGCKNHFHNVSLICLTI